MTYNIPVVSILACSLLTGGIIAADEPAVPQPQEEVKVDPQAVAILKRAADHLAAAKQFSVAAEIWEDTELEEGGRVQFTRLVEVR